ncbi:MAG: efflux RND transporter periplasmic adaptor subunit [Lachnospiraceae bacterium]|nr:efflux RND transporter periplasmic adaptor subunit [Lachnospiraceae bacterium]
MKRFMTRQRESNKEKKSAVNWKRTSCGLLAMTVLMSSVALAGCGSQEADVTEEETVKAIQVETAAPSTNTIQVMSDFIGTVEGSEETSIIPKIAGEVTSKNFEVGDYVNAGDLLFTIDDTALQISRTSAEASVQMAQANLNTAEAGLIAQQASNGATKASVSETLGTMSTTEQQLENSVNSAKRNVGAAKGSKGLANESFVNAQKQADNVKDNKESAEDNIGYTEEYLESLTELQKRYNNISQASDIDAAKEEAKSHGISDSELSGFTEKTEVANYYLSLNSNYSSGEELAVVVSSARNAYEGAKSTDKSLEGSYSSALVAQIQAAISTQTSADSLKSAEEAQALAEKYKEDYENFTKNTITANANAQIVGGDAQVISSANSVTTANANLTSANAQLASANLQLDYTKVTSPVSGVIQQINVQQYEMASNQSVAYVISSTDSKKVTFYVAENAMKNMSMGQSVTIEKEGTTYDASISNIESTVDAQKGLFKVEVTLTGSGADSFITGTSVKLTTATQQAIDVMTVPIDAVYYESEQAYVYCAKDGVAVRTDITTGIADENNVEVVSGLTPGDKVITSWGSQLKDGAVIEEAVKVQDTTEEAVTETSTEESTTEAQTEDANAAQGEQVETTDNVNIRAAASTDSEKVGMAVTGQKYTRLEEAADGWSKIVYEGSDAYVKTEYLKSLDAEDMTEQDAPETVAETETETDTTEATTEATTEVTTETATEEATNQEETVNE